MAQGKSHLKVSRSNGVHVVQFSDRKILEELSIMMEKEMELGRQIKSGLRYPIIVILVIAIAFVVLMTYVIPRFVDFYGAFGAVSGFFDSLGITLQVVVIVIGAIEILLTYLLPQSSLLKIPRILRIVNALIKAVDYLQKGFKKLEESRGGLSPQKERNEADYIKKTSDDDASSTTV